MDACWMLVSISADAELVFETARLPEPERPWSRSASSISEALPCSRFANAEEAGGDVEGGTCPEP